MESITNKELAERREADQRDKQISAEARRNELAMIDRKIAELLARKKQLEQW